MSNPNENDQRLNGSGSPSLPGYVIVGIFIFIFVGAFLFFLTTDSYRMMKAKSLYSRGDLVGGIELIDGIIGRTGPTKRLLAIRDEGLFGLSHNRMDRGRYDEAIPLLEKIIQKNGDAIAVGGDPDRILEAIQDKVVCHLLSAQGRGQHVDPFDLDLTYAEDAIKEGLDFAEKTDSERSLEISQVLRILRANIQTERAAYFWYVGDPRRAGAYLFDADEELNAVLEENPSLREDYQALIVEIKKLKKEMEG